MRVALFTDTYPDDVNGVAHTLARLTAHAAERGHEVALVTPRVAARSDGHARWHRQLPGLPIPFYPQLQLARPLDREWAATLEAFRPDLVHVATEAPVGLSGRRWALRRGVPLVTSYHTHFPRYLHDYRMGMLEPALWRYLRWFHGRSLRTFCPSDDTRGELLRHGFHARLRIWGRGVDTDLFGPHRRREEVREAMAPGAGRILVHVGRLAAEKRVDLVLDAFGRIREVMGPGTALVFVGDGPEGPRLRARAGDGVHFTGFLRGTDLAEAYAAGDLFVFGSDTETFGNVVLEALASGLPAVVVDRGGVRETVHPGRTGIRVRPGDSDALARGCLELLRDDERRLALARGALEEARSRSWPTILDGLLEEYRRVVATPGGPEDRATARRPHGTGSPDRSTVVTEPSVRRLASG